MRIMIVIIAFFVYTALFKKAAGTLSLLKLNMISFSYYLSLIFCFIGASLIYCGFRDHYLAIKVTDETADKTYYILLWTLIMFPLSICIFNRLFGISNVEKSYNSMLKQNISGMLNSDLVWLIVIVLSGLCILSMIYVFKHIGFFTLTEFFNADSDTLARNRIKVTREFSGNTYIRNIVMLGLTPVLSYFAYIYMRLTNQFKWKVLFGVLLICSIIVKTYNFEKSPVVYYFFYFYVLEILLGNIKMIKYLVAVGALGIVVILGFYYMVFDYNGPLLSLSSGPGGRIFITQIATLFLHVQAFPELHPYLNGASLPTIYSKLFGLESSWIRSGRVVMEVFNPSGVANGTAGVMNSIFVGEAYANWGMVGVVIAPIFVGFLFSFVTCFFLKQKKTPLTIVTYLIIFMNYTQVLLGGFVDYLYSSVLLFMLFLVLGVSICKNRGKIKLMVSTR